MRSKFDRWVGWICGAAVVLGIAVLAGCTPSDTPVVNTPTVQSQFFPIQNGLLYTYLRLSSNRYDTLSLRLITGNPGQEPVFVFDGIRDTFYRIDLTRDANFNQAAVISTDTSSLMVLDGTLEDGATWVADDIHRIHATVIKAQYDDYYLPGEAQDYKNVLVVQYHQDGEPDDSYTLRYFAQGHGLILEQQIVGRLVIASLELISIQTT